MLSECLGVKTLRLAAAKSQPSGLLRSLFGSSHVHQRVEQRASPR